MSSKSFDSGARPSKKHLQALDDFVSNGPAPVEDAAPAEKPKAAPEKKGDDKKPETGRLAIDLPVNLHRRIKASCALRGVNMTNEITALLAEKYPE